MRPTTHLIGLFRILAAVPPDYFALVEQNIRGPIPDVLTLQLSPGPEMPSNGTTTLAVATAPPRTRLVRRNEADIYAGKANRITVRYRHGRLVLRIEHLLPSRQKPLAQFNLFLQEREAGMRHGDEFPWVDIKHSDATAVIVFCFEKALV